MNKHLMKHEIPDFADKLRESLNNSACDLGVKDLANRIIADDKFLYWSGSSQSFQHHYGVSGLIRHTYEVVTIGLATINHYERMEQFAFSDSNNDEEFDYKYEWRVDRAEYFLAALFHDVGKMWDYEMNITGVDRLGDPKVEFKANNHKREIHHISRSAITWSKYVDDFPELKEKYHDNVLHAILSHHGQREWGSPVAPNTRTAWLLHLCDGISARLNDSDTLDIVRKGKEKM